MTFLRVIIKKIIYLLHYLKIEFEFLLIIIFNSNQDIGILKKWSVIFVFIITK